MTLNAPGTLAERHPDIAATSTGLLGAPANDNTPV
jgi:hypothetical protein